MKRFKTVASIMLTCLAVSFIIGTAYVYVKSFTSSVRSQQMNDVVSAEPQLMAEDNSVRFNSIAEYVAYLNSSEYVCQNTLEQNQASSASQDYYLPGVLPSNTSLASITMNDEGTTFTYSYDIDFSNIFDFNTDDDVIAEMTRTMIAKEYQLDFVSNHPELNPTGTWNLSKRYNLVKKRPEFLDYEKKELANEFLSSMTLFDL